MRFNLLAAVTPRAATKRINWDDEDALFNIDWGYYRLFCHPAVKGC